VAALREIAGAEISARPGEISADVVFAASPELAELSRHPPIRETALALAGWPEEAGLGIADVEVVVDPAARESVTLRLASGEPIRPSPLHRVRSTTVPEGCYRLVAGWSFTRQHTPWAFSWGPLAAMPRLPRVRIDGFVIAPSSWALPDEGRLLQRGGLARWRRQYRVPAVVQVGEGDELLHVDLRDPGAAAELARYARNHAARVFEIWPPLDRLVDAGSRRVEAVAAVVNAPDADGSAAHESDVRRIRSAGTVLPPTRRPPAPGWVTFKIYGDQDRQGAVLLGALLPVLKEVRGRAAREAGRGKIGVRRWFFLPYRDRADGRPHLRVRFEVADATKGALVDRVEEALIPYRQAGDVAVVEVADYYREEARYGGPAMMPLVEEIFEHDSDLALGILGIEVASAEEPAAARRELVVRAFDALPEGLGLDAAARRALAAAQRAARSNVLAGEAADLDAEYRKRSARLMDFLGSRATDEFSPALAAYRAVVQAVRERATPAEGQALRRGLPSLLHMTAVRIGGGDEAAAFVFWERALEGLAARRRQS
jgi:thiopeptide-type bacteriocin biosynthesis protein